MNQEIKKYNIILTERDLILIDQNLFLKLLYILL